MKYTRYFYCYVPTACAPPPNISARRRKRTIRPRDVQIVAVRSKNTRLAAGKKRERRWSRDANRGLAFTGEIGWPIAQRDTGERRTTDFHERPASTERDRPRGSSRKQCPRAIRFCAAWITLDRPR